MNINDIATKVPHFRTTFAGILLIAGSIAVFVGQWVATGMPDAPAWSILGTALTTGSGLIASADAKAVTPSNKSQQ